MKLDKYYLGIVEDNIDLKRLGRLKVRVFGLFDEISTDLLPWVSPNIDISGTSYSIPAVGKLVNVIFDMGNIYCPYYTYSEKYNINLQDKLTNLSDDEYKSFKALLFDHKTQIYADNESLTIDYLINKVKITSTDINLELKDNSGSVRLGTANADQAAVLGNHFILDWFTEFVKILAKPTTLTGNLAAPILKPELDAHLQLFLTNPDKFISSNVFIVDNDSVTELERSTQTSEVEHDDTAIIAPSDNGTRTVETSSEVSKPAKEKIKTDQAKEKSKLEKAKPSSKLNVTKPNIEYTKPNSTKPNVDDSVFGSRGRSDVLDSEQAKSKMSSSTIKDDPIYGKYKIKT